MSKVNSSDLKNKNPLSVSFKTIGCKFNQSETDDLQNKFLEQGYEIKKFGETVNLTIINTCTVTNAADRDCRNLIRQAKRASPAAFIVVMGCYVETAEAEISKMPEVDLVLNNKNKFSVIDAISSKLQQSSHSCTHANTYEHTHINTHHRIRAFLKVQEGCNYFCSYCIVPFVRGKPRAFSSQQILTEARQLIDRGFIELVLTGINVGTYFDTENNTSFEALINELQNIKGIKRLRLSSLEPNTISQELLTLIKNSNIICPHLHIPLQAGDDAVLTAMNRKYTTAEYQELMFRIQQTLPDVALGTDIIAGFPTETDEQFQNTLHFVTQQPFTYFHVFSYSDRSGTAACKLKEKVNPKIIKQRAHELLAIGQKKKEAYLKKNLGQEKFVYFDQINKSLKLGYTDNYIRVGVEAEEIKRGDLRKVFLHELMADGQGVKAIQTEQVLAQI